MVRHYVKKGTTATQRRVIELFDAKKSPSEIHEEIDMPLRYVTNLLRTIKKSGTTRAVKQADDAAQIKKTAKDLKNRIMPRRKKQVGPKEVHQTIVHRAVEGEEVPSMRKVERVVVKIPKKPNRTRTKRAKKHANEALDEEGHDRLTSSQRHQGW